MIVDTSAVVAILKGEPDSDRLAELILADADAKVSTATMVELYAVADVRGNPAQCRRVDALLAKLHIRAVPFDADQAALARIAARDFGRGSGNAAELNFCDCFSYALAAVTGEPLICVGDDFKHTDLEVVSP